MTTNTETLTYDHIVALALENGFKLKPQVDGRMALNDYVIDFARAVYDIGHAAAKAETADVGEPVAPDPCGSDSSTELGDEQCECERCCGKGWNWEEHQVAERKSDVQTLKIHCDKCEGTGYELG